MIKTRFGVVTKINIMSKTNVRPYTDKQLLDKVKNLPNYKSIPRGIWILGVRSNEDAPNVYDDKFYVFHGEKFMQVLTGTTNCGTPVLTGGYKKYNKKGAFILEANKWHHKMWKYIYRSSRGHELRQVNEVTGYRDNNNNQKSEQIGNVVKGLFGINFHTNTFKYYNSFISWIIGWNSAGCQVTNQRKEFKQLLMTFAKRLKQRKQIYVTYCLIDEFVP